MPAVLKLLLSSAIVAMSSLENSKKIRASVSPQILIVTGKPYTVVLPVFSTQTVYGVHTSILILPGPSIHEL